MGGKREAVFQQMSKVFLGKEMKKSNLTIRLTDEARQILEESASRLGLNLSSFVELAIRAQAKQLDQECALLES